MVARWAVEGRELFDGSLHSHAGPFFELDRIGDGNARDIEEGCKGSIGGRNSGGGGISTCVVLSPSTDGDLTEEETSRWRG